MARVSHVVGRWKCSHALANQELETKKALAQAAEGTVVLRCFALIQLRECLVCLYVWRVVVAVLLRGVMCLLSAFFSNETGCGTVG